MGVNLSSLLISKSLHLVFSIPNFQYNIADKVIRSIPLSQFSQATWESKMCGLVLQAMKKFTDGDALSILDPMLEKSAANNLAIEKILELSLQCLAQRRQHRPSMKRCAEILWSIRKDYKEISAPDLHSLSTRSQRSTSTRE